MATLHHSPLLKHIREYFRNADTDETIFIFVPYVQSMVLDELLRGVENRIVVTTTWEPKDILYGSSDLELYTFCRDNDITLYLAKRMHFKVYSVGLRSAVLATGNISHNGLLPDGNYEAAVDVDRLTCADRMVFEKILKGARVPDDRMYEDLSSWKYHNAPNPHEPGATPPSLEDLCPSPTKADFLTSALPMTKNVDDLASGYERINLGLEPSEDPETAACVFHDLANYGMELGLSREEFYEELAVRFFEHPFIRRIDEFIAPEAYFGRIKEWIQGNCADVPVPSKRELTGNVQVLLEWFVKLGGDRYAVDVPGSRSQRIRKRAGL